jgi:FKBP-type peptidyl-prolyl cis-trans isomerase FklB
MIRVSLAALAVFSFVGLASAQQPAPKGTYEPTQGPSAVRPAPAPAATPAPAAAPATPSASGMSTAKQKASYGIGQRIGRDLRSSQLTVDDCDLPALLRGIADAFTRAKPAVASKDLMQAENEFQTALLPAMQERMKATAEKNKKEGEAFLAANKSKPGVKATASGLQYKVLKSGSGATPTTTDEVTVHYRGTLLDGTEFDSSLDRGEPASFPVTGVIPGWTEAIQLMKVGDKWQLFIPANLAYDQRGSGPDIGPNSVLIFDVELLDVKKGGEAIKATPQ